MTYVKVKNGNAISLESRPRWYNDDGSDVPDAMLIEHGYYPLDRTPPAYNLVTHSVQEMPIAEWGVGVDKVNVTYSVVPNTLEASLSILTNAVHRVVNEVPKDRHYDNQVALSSYVNSGNLVWAAEAQAFVAWRDAIWLYVYEEFAKIEIGSRPIPIIEELLAELPSIDWPNPSPIEPLDVPITKRQMLGVLADSGVDAEPIIDGAIEAIEDTATRAKYRNDWRYAGGFVRQHPLFNDPAFMALLEMDEGQINTLWVIAQEYPA